MWCVVVRSGVVCGGEECHDMVWRLRVACCDVVRSGMVLCGGEESDVLSCLIGSCRSGWVIQLYKDLWCALLITGISK